MGAETPSSAEKVLLDGMKSLYAKCFGDSLTYTERAFALYVPRPAPASTAYVTDAKGNAISEAFCRITEMRIGGKTLRVPFLFGICTAPEHRHEHLASKVIAELLSRLKADGYPFALLHPFNHDFYRKLGFETVSYVDYHTPSRVATQKDIGAKPITSEDIPVCARLFYELNAERDYLQQNPPEIFAERFRIFLEDDGLGYLILKSGTPIGYVVIEDNKIAEAHIPSLSVLDGLKEIAGLKVPYYPAKPSPLAEESAMAYALNEDAAAYSVADGSKLLSKLFGTCNAVVFDKY